MYILLSLDSKYVIYFDLQPLETQRKNRSQNYAIRFACFLGTMQPIYTDVAKQFCKFVDSLSMVNQEFRFFAKNNIWIL